MKPNTTENQERPYMVPAKKNKGRQKQNKKIHGMYIALNELVEVQCSDV